MSEAKISYLTYSPNYYSGGGSLSVSISTGAGGVTVLTILKGEKFDRVMSMVIDLVLEEKEGIARQVAEMEKPASLQNVESKLIEGRNQSNE